MARAGGLQAYAYGTLATAVKTVAWWLNQWPALHGRPFLATWAVSAAVAGLEYLPLTMAFATAGGHGVHLGLMTAYMEAMDNLCRMLQQVGLRAPLAWFDWGAALGLGLCVVYQGAMHRQADRRPGASAGGPAFHRLGEASGGRMDEDDSQNDEDGGDDKGALSPFGTSGASSGAAAAAAAAPAAAPAGGRYLAGLDKERFVIFVVGVLVLGLGMPVVALAGGWAGKAYALATVATAAKTFAWWINQYPQLQHLGFVQKWLAGWGIAALIEYFPLIGAMTVASGHGVHLGLMTAYMEALDNLCRVLQQRLLQKPLARHDYIAPAGMFVCVVFQGIMRYRHDMDMAAAGASPTTTAAP
jgi:hypothetical protein